MNSNISSKIKNRIRTAVSSAGRDALLPVFDSFLFEMSDDENISICGCRGVIAYSGTEISLLTDRFTIIFKGDGLFIKNYGGSSVIISGRVDSVSFGRDKDVC